MSSGAKTLPQVDKFVQEVAAFGLSQKIIKRFFGSQSRVDKLQIALNRGQIFGRISRLGGVRVADIDPRQFAEPGDIKPGAKEGEPF